MYEIVCVDDEPMLLDGLRRALFGRHASWRLRFVDSGAAALEELEERPADVVVCDYRMPGMDGARLLSELKARYPATARVVLSGHTDESDTGRLVTVAQRFLTKPCLAGVLERTVAGTLSYRDAVGPAARAAIGRIGSLPVQLATLNAVSEMLDSGSVDAAMLGRVLATDVGLAAKVLQCVNGSFFTLGSRVTSLEVAAQRLGAGALRRLVDAVFASSEATATAANLSWLNASALTLARRARRACPELADAAFCAGLFADVGCWVSAACSGGETYERSGDESDLLEGECESAAGAYLLSLWGFPAEIVDAVAGVGPLAAVIHGVSAMEAAAR